MLAEGCRVGCRLGGSPCLAPKTEQFLTGAGKSRVNVITFDFAAVMAVAGAWRSNKAPVPWEPGRDGAALVHLPNGSKWGGGFPWQLLEDWNSLHFPQPLGLLLMPLGMKDPPQE